MLNATRCVQAETLHRILQTHASVIISGGASSGKSTLLAAAAEAAFKDTVSASDCHNSQQSSVLMRRVFTRAMSQADLLGQYTHASNEWRDGLLTQCVRCDSRVRCLCFCMHGVTWLRSTTSCHSYHVVGSAGNHSVGILVQRSARGL
jgi:hypothetical protein